MNTKHKKQSKTKFKALRVLSLIISITLCFNVIGFYGSAEDKYGNEEVEFYENLPKNIIAPENKVNTEDDLSPMELAVAELSPEEVPENLSIEDAVEKDHVNRLRKQEPDLNTVIFQNRDGTKTLYNYSYFVKYVDEDGIVRDKSSSLKKATDKKGFAFVNEANDIKTYYPNTLSQENGMLLEYEDIEVQMSPVSANEKTYVMTDGQEYSSAEFEIAQKNLQTDLRLGSEASKKQSTNDSIKKEASKLYEVRSTEKSAITASAQKLQKPDYSDKQLDAVDYAGVFGDNTSIRYSSTFEGFKEDIILAENTGANKFSFCLKTGGLRLEECDGAYVLVDPNTDDAMVHVGALKITDSNPQPTNEPEYKHYYEAKTVVPNEVYILTIVVDEAFLNSPDTVYPVTIDPMLYIKYRYVHDATLYKGMAENSYSARNRKSGAELFLYAGNDSSASLYLGNERFLVKSPSLVSALKSAGVTQASHIVDAKIRLFNNTIYDFTERVNVNQYNSSWSENAVCYNNSAYETTPNVPLDYTIVNSHYRGFYWWGITAAVKAWVGGTANNGLLFQSTEVVPNRELRFCASDSSDNTYRPYIEVDYSVVDGSGEQDVIPRYGNMWCWNASAEMVSRAMVTSIRSQWTSFNLAFGRSEYAVVTNADRNLGGEASHVNAAVKAFSNDTLTCTWKGKFKNDTLSGYPLFDSTNPGGGRLTDAQLQAEVSAGRPVIIYVRSRNNPSGEAGHLVVISHYNSTTGKYRVLDPCNLIDYSTGEHTTYAKVRYATYAQLSSNTKAHADDNKGIGSDSTNVWVATMKIARK